MTQAAAIVARLELARTIAREAGDITLQYFRQSSLSVERKNDGSPVTRADREAEQHLRRRIATSFPDDGIVGEEFPEQKGSGGTRWILDPIDGTKSFIHGVPLYGTLIGIEVDHAPCIGVIHIPALDEMVYAAIGHGAWYTRNSESPTPARVSSCSNLAEGLLLYSELAGFDQTGQRNLFEILHRSVRLCRTWGDCYAYLMVATGRAEVAIDPLLNIWDAAALLPVIEEAGGTFTDLKGQRRIDSGHGFATNGRVFNEVHDIVRNAQ